MSLAIRVSEIFFLPLLWFASVLGSLSIGSAVLSQDHSFCGPWGCGPPSGALLAVHTAWAAAIWPPLLYLPWRLNSKPRTIRMLGIAFIAIGTTAVIGICAWQWFVWLPQASEWAQPFFLKRCVFVIANAIDWPITQLMVVGVALFALNSNRKKSRLQIFEVS